MRVAGIMSGTSLDGIDVAVVDISGRRIETLAHRTSPYSRRTREQILNAKTPQDISRLNFVLGELYARAVLATGVEGIQLIGCHGQTIYHDRGNTLQIGSAAVIAERTGIRVVSNFRARDIAAGGHGAPLVPFFDYRMFRHPKRTRVALNIGGIANITVIPACADITQVTAFDTGPGNMVIDQLVREYNGRSFDAGGAIARRAEPDMELLARLLRDPFYKRQPPKTAGREQYGLDFIARMKSGRAPLPVLIATATLLTARTIAIGIGGIEADLIVSGGGVHNRFLMDHLHALLPAMRISTTSDHGIDADAKEAIAFALLAYETVHGRPGNVPSATGANRPVVLGDITPVW